MKLIEQVTLLFQEGKSDKVYEVDLLEVGAGQHVVNFRYGRRGTALKDGTKTPAPVSMAEARKAFDKTIEMKRRGASRVVGIDSDDRYLAQAQFAAETLGYSDILFRKLDVYDVELAEQDVRIA